MINLREEQNYKTFRDNIENHLDDPMVGKDFLNKIP